MSDEEATEKGKTSEYPPFVDRQIDLWSQKHSLRLFTSFAGRDARFAYVSSVAGECFQIWVEPPKDGAITIGAACVEGSEDNGLDSTWTVAGAELDAALEQAFQTVTDWMLPSARLPLASGA
ncbi:MAG TPA: hypothetical protein VFV07_12950 [Rhizomicrobium sp.]|nr:hypothetical protein [Rhizomicrobium sp.]